MIVRKDALVAYILCLIYRSRFARLYMPVPLAGTLARPKRRRSGLLDWNTVRWRGLPSRGLSSWQMLLLWIPVIVRLGGSRCWQTSRRLTATG